MALKTTLPGGVELTITPRQHLTTDGVSGGLRTFFDPVVRPAVAPPLLPRELALQVLKGGAGLFRWQESIPDLAEKSIIAGESLSSVRFQQTFKGVPVDGAEVVVNVCADGRLQSLYSQYRYDIPAELDPTAIRFDRSRARALVARLSRKAAQRTIGPARLVVYQHPVTPLLPLRRARRRGRARNRFLDGVTGELARGRRRGFAPVGGRYYLAWEIVVEARRPWQRWRLLIDAGTGSLLRVQDLLVYASPAGAGRVFDPNPIITSGAPALSWKHLTGSTGSAAQRDLIRQQLIDVPLPRLEQPEVPKQYRLHGLYVSMGERDDPAFAEPVRATPRFVFSATSRKFLDVMAYYHIDRFQDYVESVLGLGGLTDFVVPVDPQGYDGDDQSIGAASEIIFGEGKIPNAPDASDATIVLHELGHALQDKALPGSPAGTSSSGVPEGFADFLAAVYYDDTHKNPQATRGLWGLWGKSAGHQRSCRVATRFDDPTWDQMDAYERGEVWSAALFEIYRKLGGDSKQAPIKSAARDLIIRLHLMANYGVPPQNVTGLPGMADTATLMAQQILGADSNLAGWLDAGGQRRYPNGLHYKVIFDAFSRRALPGFVPPPIDVYIDDGRHGGYGSPKSNPTFDDSLWMDDHGGAPGVSVQAPSPPNASTGVSVQVGAQAQVFARVKNLGVVGSGPVTVRAFVAQPGAGRVWPVDWSPLVPAGPALAGVPAVPNPGVVAGPFAWTPDRAGAWAILVIVECPQDQALTELLAAADRVPIMNLVPFDNNMAWLETQVSP